MLLLLPLATAAPLLRPLRSSILSPVLVASSGIIHLLPHYSFDEGAVARHPCVSGFSERAATESEIDAQAAGRNFQ
jgi:hypothetical protein